MASTASKFFILLAFLALAIAVNAIGVPAFFTAFGYVNLTFAVVLISRQAYSQFIRSENV